MKHVPSILLLIGVALPLLCVACTETRVVRSHYGTSSPIQSTPTRFEKPPERKTAKKGWDWLAPFKAVGDGVGSLVATEKSQSMKIASPSGNTMKLPPNFTGQSNFKDDRGKSYNLIFREGALIGVEPSKAEKP